MSTVTVQSFSSRSFAGLLDLPIEGPAEKRSWDHSPEAIGGAYGIEWYEYFKDAKTGEVYRVPCCDGVNGGRGAYSPKDEEARSACYYSLAERFQKAAEDGKTEIFISRNERVVMQGHTHAFLLESADDKGDGKQSNDGLEGGLVGHFHGIPVICDLQYQDLSLPWRQK